MELSEENIEQLKKDFQTAKTYDDLMGKDGAIKKLLKLSIENMLNAELTEHLGYPKHSPVGNNSGNSRNGNSTKTLKNDHGEIEIKVPRDRNGEFDPILIKKYERTIGPIEDKIISMYAKGMSTRDIQSHVEDIYGIEISPSMVSNITDKILDTVKQWQNRPLEKLYPIVFFDAIHYKVRDDGRVLTKAAYTCLAIDLQGRKDLLGLWIGQSEAAHFWLNIMTELKNRGVEDILIACVDGLKGFPEAINTVFPKTAVQLCIIHMVRNTLKKISYYERELFMGSLKKLYTAPTEEAAMMQMDNLEANWGKKYPSAIKLWRNNWSNAMTFMTYPKELRKIIYTTNAVEALHRQFRKITKAKSLFPNDESLRKILYLAYMGTAKKWTIAIHKWQVALNHLTIIFEDRFNENI
jgi:transposase-like protein